MTGILEKFASRRGVEAVERPDPKADAALRKRRRRQREAFAVIPLWWARQAHEGCGEYGPANILVCAELVRRAWQTKDESFVMPKVMGVGKKVKTRSLRGLEAAKLITVEWRPGRSPVVTLTPNEEGRTILGY